MREAAGRADQRILEAEFPSQVNARLVLSAVGHGERTITEIVEAVQISPGNLKKPLDTLVHAKRVVRVEEPLSWERLNAPRYSEADPYLRFWLRFVERELPAIERLRTDEVVRRILEHWSGARGARAGWHLRPWPHDARARWSVW